MKVSGFRLIYGLKTKILFLPATKAYYNFLKQLCMLLVANRCLQRAITSSLNGKKRPNPTESKRDTNP